MADVKGWQKIAALYAAFLIGNLVLSWALNIAGIGQSLVVTFLMAFLIGYVASRARAALRRADAEIALRRSLDAEP